MAAQVQSQTSYSNSPCEVLTSACPGDRGTELGAALSEQSNKRSYPDLASEAER